MCCLKYWIAVVFALGSGISAGALTWEKTLVETSAEAGTSEVKLEFPFKNESDRTVIIQELKASCGCSTPSVESKTIPAGGAGVVTVAFAAGSRVGPQSARLTVVTDEPGVAPATLDLKIDLRPALELTPRLVRWSRGGEADSRTITIKQLSQSPVTLVDIKPVNDAVSAELKSGAEPGAWELVLTPKTIAIASTTKVEIRATVGERTATYSVFAVVR